MKLLKYSILDKNNLNLFLKIIIIFTTLFFGLKFIPTIILSNKDLYLILIIIIFSFFLLNKINL
jgi:hypothetical protein